MEPTILVFAKQVPDTQNITGDAMKEDGTVNRGALPAIFNPEDLHALEMALQVREEYGGKVVIATMGPPTATQILRHALYMGADEAILLSDKKFAGADTLATGYTLAAAVKRYGDVDIVMCGRQAIDGDTAQVGPQLADKLDWPQITYVEDVEALNDNSIRVRNVIEGGYEVAESPFPVLLTVVADANTPRPPGAKRIMKYKKAMTRTELSKKYGDHNYEEANELATEEEQLRERGLWIHEWGVNELGVESDRVGLSGSPTTVKQIESVVLTSRDQQQFQPTDDGIRKLVHELIEEHILS